MKTTTKVILGVLALSASTFLLMAEGNGKPARPPRGEEGGGPGGPGGPGHRPPPPPVMVVLDANHDGVIDAAHPEVLMYEPKNGKMELLGVEYLVLADAWNAKNDAPPVRSTSEAPPR